jgi:threonine synthase
MVRDNGYATATNYLDPPVGSDPYGIDAYKTLGYELAEHVAKIEADAILVPTARGDLLWGIYTGLSEAVAEGLISGVPCLIAVEPFGRLEHVLAGDDVHAHYPGTSLLSSINGDTVTFQSLAAVRGGGGTAVSVTSEQVGVDRARLAAAGLYLELSSAAPLTALRLLLEAKGKPFRRAIIIATSHGYKETA